MGMLGQLAFNGQHVEPQVFATWNDNFSALMREAGDEYFARYTARVANVTLPTSPGSGIDLRPVYQAMIELHTEVITDLSIKREQSQARVAGIAPEGNLGR